MNEVPPTSRLGLKNTLIVFGLCLAAWSILALIWRGFLLIVSLF